MKLSQLESEVAALNAKFKTLNFNQGKLSAKVEFNVGLNGLVLTISNQAENIHLDFTNVKILKGFLEKLEL